jgi:hypothetical protein
MKDYTFVSYLYYSFPLLLIWLSHGSHYTPSIISIFLLSRNRSVRSGCGRTYCVYAIFV